MPVLIALLAIIIIFALVYAAAGIRIVRPYQRGVIEYLGKYKETADPGLRIILPFVQRMRMVDMREQVIDVPPQEVITQDNVAVAVDAVVYFEPTDPQRLIYNVSNFILAVTKLAQTNLRNVIGEMTLDEAFTSRERVNSALRQILDDATDKWGVRVVRVEIQRIDPPVDVMNAMHEQMKAERTRRAVVTEAEGTRQAAITRADGEKQAAILEAEGVRQRDILTAEGEAQAVRTRAEAEQFRLEVEAEGEAHALESVFGAIDETGVDDRYLALKYMEALQGIADGKATKIFLPAEMSNTLGSLGGIAELFKPDGDDGAPRIRTEAAARAEVAKAAREERPAPTPKPRPARTAPPATETAPPPPTTRRTPPPPSG